MLSIDEIAKQANMSIKFIRREVASGNLQYTKNILSIAFKTRF